MEVCDARRYGEAAGNHGVLQGPFNPRSEYVSMILAFLSLPEYKSPMRRRHREVIVWGYLENGDAQWECRAPSQRPPIPIREEEIVEVEIPRRSKEERSGIPRPQDLGSERYKAGKR